ncbi:MAG: FAD:protein FMN transferase, partial [Gemmataceae bacterium]
MFSTALAILAILPGLSGTPALERHAFSEPHMGTLFRVVVFAPDEPTAKAAARDAFARAAALNNVMSDYQATSELMRLCARAGQGFVPVSKDLFQVLSRAQKVSRDSEGAFDVTIGPVIRLWRIARKSRTLPAPDRLLAARELVGWKNLELDEKTCSVRLLKPGMQLDLGGIGKGFAADEMLKVLARHGLTRAMVVAGGDVTVADPPPGKPGWTIAIAPIDSRKEGSRYLVLANAAVSSSGDAEQYVEIDGVRYSHMVDPRTGVGLIGRMSA